MITSAQFGRFLFSSIPVKSPRKEKTIEGHDSNCPFSDQRPNSDFDFMPAIELLTFTHFAPRKQRRYPTAQNGLFCVEKGKLQLHPQAGEACLLAEGEFAFYHSDQFKEALALPGEQGFSAVVLIFTPALLQKFRNSYPLVSATTNQTEFLTKFGATAPALQQLKQLLIESVSRKGPQLAQEHLALALLSLMVDAQPQLLESIFAATQFSETQKIICYIEENLDHEISLESLAQHMGMSIATLKRRLAAEEMSFSQLLKIKRISYATNQLRNSHKSINEIATESGFKSAAHFSTAFKALQHMTPKEFRAKVSGKS